MARIRSDKPESYQSETLAEISLAAERTFRGMATIADDRGRLTDKPAQINGELWSMRSEREPHTSSDLDAELQGMVKADLICRYVGCDGKRYIHLVRWDAHQKIDRPSRSFSIDVSDYHPLCHPCHFKMDAGGRETCSRGHKRTPENTSYRPDGSRRCLVCHRDEERERNADPAARERKRASDREHRHKNPLTPEQRARKTELQRACRAAARAANSYRLGKGGTTGPTGTAA